MTDPRFAHERYKLRRSVFVVFGGEFKISDGTGVPVLYSLQKAFKLKEDIRIYGDETATAEVLTIRARSIVDFSAAYDVVDATTGEHVGIIKRRGWKSMVRDAWVIHDADDRPVATAIEDAVWRAVLRRIVGIFSYLPALLPQRYHVDVDGQTVATMHQNFNPFVYKLNIDFSLDTGRVLDRRLGLALAVLLAAIEGKQG